MWWNIKLYKVVGVILIENVSDILVQRDNRFGIIVSRGHFSEEFGVGSVYLTQTLWLRWVKCWFHLPQLKHGGQDWPDQFHQGFPDSTGTAYTPNHVDARANDQNVCKGVFCSIALASKRPTVISHHRMVSRKGWTACPLTVVASKTVGGQCFRSVDWPWGPIIPELSFLNSSIGCLALSQVRGNRVPVDWILDRIPQSTVSSSRLLNT